jgi:FkbM family methyltransferase
MDVWSIKETFLDRFYEKYGFRIQPGWNIIDIGAGLGDFTLFAATAQPDTRVFAFEPFPESFGLAQENLQINRVAHVKLFDQAVAAASGKLVLDLAGNEPLQIRSQLEAVENTQHLTVGAFSLSDVLVTQGIESCNLLKLDCEGAEYPILFNTSQQTLEHIERIVMEYHDDVTEYTHHDLARFLSEHGFRVETFSNPVHSNLGYLRASREK